MTPYKNIAVLGKPDGTHLVDPLQTLVSLLRKRGLRVVMDPRTAGASKIPPDRVVELESLSSDVDLVVVIGGDGTLLAAARQAAARHVPLVGINLGRLGFLTDIPAEAIDTMLGSVLDGDCTTEQRLMLHATVLRHGKLMFESIAFNDVVLSRGAMGSMIEFSVEVNREFVYSVRADGLIVATPTGSTAYALSVGGPVLHPALPVIALVPISPHTLSNRPVVIPNDSEVEVKLIRGQNARVNFDVQAYFDLQPGDMLVVKVHGEKVTLLHPRGYSYYSMLRTKLHWNELT